MVLLWAMGGFTAHIIHTCHAIKQYMHADQCPESLRRVILCQADVSVITIQ